MFLSQIKQTIARYGLIRPGDTLLIGVSGGPDSTALACAMHVLRKTVPLTLFIAHLDHGLRPESGGDASFVISLGNKLDIPVVTARANIAASSGKRGSLEELARTARLRFFYDVSRRVRAHAVALGHTRDDQAETVLMRIIRGTGLYGLAGMLPKRVIGGLTVIRPLIETGRADIAAYLKSRGITPRVDATNKLDVFLRNRIRNELLPLLERRYNKNIRAVLISLADNAGTDYDYLLRSAARTRNQRTPSSIPLAFLRIAHPAISRLLLRQAIAAVQGDTRRITFTHAREIEDLIRSRPVNSVVDLPQGISVKKTAARITVYRR